MKLKKLMALALVGVTVLSAVGCGGTAQSGSSTADTTAADGTEAETTEAKANSAETLVVWTLADDLKQFAQKYTEATGTPVDVQVIAPADYSTKLTSALGAKSKDVDIIVGEPQMLPNFFEAGFFDDLSDLDADANRYLYAHGRGWQLPNHF